MKPLAPTQVLSKSHVLDIQEVIHTTSQFTSFLSCTSTMLVSAESSLTVTLNNDALASSLPFHLKNSVKNAVSASDSFPALNVEVWLWVLEQNSNTHNSPSRSQTGFPNTSFHKIVLVSKKQVLNLILQHSPHFFSRWLSHGHTFWSLSCLILNSKTNSLFQ